jgi:hypothetical protein
MEAPIFYWSKYMTSSREVQSRAGSATGEFIWCGAFMVWVGSGAENLIL